MDKEDKDKKKEEKYYSTVKDYQVLEDIEHVRKRPGNYIGSTDERGWHHLFQEIVDNSIDEVVAGNCDKIKIILSDNQKTITVEDNGLGIVMDTHPKTNQSVLVTLFSCLKSGGKFSDKVYKTSGGLHGLGITIVNALSRELKAWNRRQGRTQIVEFNQGILKNERFVDSQDEPDGLTVSFTPDPLIFKDFSYFKIDVISNRLKELSYLNPKLTITFQYSSQKEPIVFCNLDGISGLVTELTKKNGLVGTFVHFEEWFRSEPYFYLSFAWRYLDSFNKSYLNKSFCNNINTSGGGTHVEGFEAGLVGAIRDWVKDKYSQVKVNVLKDDVLEGLVVVLSIRMKEPQFAGQTKSSLSDKYVRDLVKVVVYDLIKKFLQDNSNVAEIISQKIIISAQNRIKTEEYHSSLRDSGRGFILPGKLTPCVSKNSEETFLFLVEGDSAGGSAKSARDPNIQAILPLKGKIINIEKSEAKRIFANEEIKNVVNALGLSVSEAAQNYYNRFRDKLDDPNWSTISGLAEDFMYCDEEGEEHTIPAHVRLNRAQVTLIVEQSKKRLLEKIRYGKIVIMADADPDGNHIESLELTFFVCFFRYLIEEGRLFLAVPPLYRLKGKKSTKYFFNDWELECYRKEVGFSGGYLQRFKGLGEMDPVDLRETTMDPKKSHFYKVLLTDVVTTHKVVNDLMGPESEYRRRYLESGEYKNAVLKVIDDEVELYHTLLVKFLAYAHEVVEERALPEEDGLKPVQRRILYTCKELSLLPGSAFRKSSKIAGDVMGDFHPHGTEAIYQAMVKMAQEFNYRYPLIDGQGNWGSIDGDSPAQMRYTEARLTSFGALLLEDLSFSSTIEWKENYDSTKKEPKILPPNLNLLLNGSRGIAVGMNTNIPPHNLAEVVEAVVYLIENSEVGLDEILTILPAPDFPTGGEILECSELKKIYETGEGTIFIRARAEVLENVNLNKRFNTIRIYEIPYKVTKSSLIESISEIIKEKKVEGLKSIEDYSNLENPVNIHLSFDSNYDAEVILNQLYKYTKLQSTFSVKFRALIGGKPKLLTLVEALRNFIKWRLEHIRKKAIFIYDKNQKELGELELKRFIIDNYKEIVEIVNQQNISEEDIKREINSKFSLAEDRVKRLLDIPSTFRQFIPERKKKLEEDIDRLTFLNEQQRCLIDNEEERRKFLINELNELKKRYSFDKRRTIISDKSHQISERQLVPFEERIVFLSNIRNKNKVNNYLTVNSLSFLDPTNIPSQGKELRLRGDVFWAVMKLNRRDDLWLFTNYGKVCVLNFFRLMGVNKTFNLDEEYFMRERAGEISSFLRPSEFFTSAIVMKEKPTADFLLIVTKNGKIKYFRLTSLFNKIGRSGRQLLTLKRDVIRCNEHQEKLDSHVTESISHVCGFSCEISRSFNREIAKCLNCRIVFREDNDEIFRSVLVKDDDIVEVVVKSKLVSGNIKNQKISLQRLVRIRIEIFLGENKIVVPKYCLKHQDLAVEHLIKHKRDGVSCSLTCSFLKEFGKEIKVCSLCQSPQLFTKVWRKRITGKEMVDVIVSSSTNNNKNSILLLIRKDNVIEKKIYSKEKNFLGMDNRLRKANLCKRHWMELDSLNDLQEQAILSCQEERSNLENCLVSSPLAVSEKEKLVKKIQLSETKELFKRISVSQVDTLISKEVIDEQTDKIFQIARDYQKFLQMKQNVKSKLTGLKEKMRFCSGCQKYCDVHNQKLLTHAESCFHCSGQNEEFITINRALENDIQTVKEQLINKDLILSKKNELELILLDLKVKKEKLNRKAFSLRQICPVLAEFRGVGDKCINCQKQTQKKHLIKIENPITRVFLIEDVLNIVNPEIYLLTKDKSVCLYNKKDLLRFLTSDSRGKSLLRDKTRSIIYISINY